MIKERVHARVKKKKAAVFARKKYEIAHGILYLFPLEWVYLLEDQYFVWKAWKIACNHTEECENL